MTALFANNASSRLPSDLPAGATSFAVMAGEGVKFPTPTAGNHFMVTLEDRRTKQIEICRCTGRSGDILTVTRAQEGTASQLFRLGATVSNRLTAGTVTDFAGVPEAPQDNKVYARGTTQVWIETIRKTTYDTGLTTQDARDDGQDALISTARNDITNIQNKNTAQDGRLDAVEAKNTAQDGRLTAVEEDNDTQDAAIAANAAWNSDQDIRLTAVETKNNQQDTNLTTINADQIAQNNRLTAVEDKNTAQDAAIAAKVSFPEAPNDANAYGRKAATWVDVTEEAPNDGLGYMRKNGGWTPSTGGAYTDDSPPPAPLQDGQLWWKSSTGVSYIWYDDGNSAQWVQFAGGGIVASEPYTFQQADMSLHSISNACVAFNDKADGTGSNMLTFYDNGTMGFKGTGTTPRDYLIRSLNGVLLIDGPVGAITQIAEGLTVGDNLSVSGNATVSGTFGVTGASTFTGTLNAGPVRSTSNSVFNLGSYFVSDTSFGAFQSGAVRYITVVGTGYCFNCNGANGDMSWMQPGGYNWFARASDAAFIIRGQAYKPAGGVWADASDERIKTIVGDYESGLDQILGLQPVRYRFKGNDSNGPPENKPEEPVMDEETGEMVTPLARNKSAPTVPYWNSPHRKSVEEGTEFIGLIAQATELVMPEMVTQMPFYIDGVEVQDLRNLDTSPLVFALINAVKTLTARIEALEAGNGV